MIRALFNAGDNGLLIQTSTGLIMRLFKDASGNPYESDAGQAIPWVYVPGEMISDRGGFSRAWMLTYNRYATQTTRAIRFVTLIRDGRNGTFLGLVDRGQDTASKSGEFEISPLDQQPGYTFEIGIAGRNSAQYVRHLTLQLANQGGNEAN